MRARRAVSRAHGSFRGGSRVARTPSCMQDAGLLVSELVTNSVRHAGQPAGAPVHIRAAAVDGVVRFEVEDHGHGPVRRRAPIPHKAASGCTS